MRYSEPITVGIDGSSNALAAARWAAHTASIHQTTLDIVFAVEAASPPLIEYAVPETFFDAARLGAKAALNAATEVALDEDPDLAPRTHIVTGSPRGELLARSRASSMVAVGASGTGRLTAAFIGSTASALTSHSVCPLAVIREHSNDAPPNGRVTVGVDGSPESLEALDWAAHEATDRAAELVVLSAWDATGFDHAHKAFTTAAHQIEGTLAVPVEAIKRRLPRLRVTTQIVDDAPVAALTKASAESDVVVVGSRGRGGFTGLLLGSTSQRVLHSAQCPLIIVP